MHGNRDDERTSGGAGGRRSSIRAGIASGTIVLGALTAAAVVIATSGTGLASAAPRAAKPAAVPTLPLPTISLPTLPLPTSSLPLPSLPLPTGSSSSPSKSPTKSPSPTAKPKLAEHPKESVRSPRRGRLKVQVRTHPKVSGDRVRFYRRVGGSWRRLGSARTHANGTASKTFHGRPGKVYKIRSTTAAKGQVKSGRTPSRRVRVKR